MTARLDPATLADAKARYDADRVFMRREAPDWQMPPWSRTRRWDRWPYINAAWHGEPVPTDAERTAEMNAPASEDGDA